MIARALAAMALAAAAPAVQAQADRATAIAARIADPTGGLIVVAHRGCHAAVPERGLPGAPENSRAALDACVALGVDVMETDVRRSRDGVLVMIHDATLDRTTDGHGPVIEQTLAQLRNLRLRADMGGPQVPLTDQRILTLQEMLERADRRIVLNLDVKDMIYAEVVDAVRRAGAERRVIVKTLASTATAPLAAMPPFDRVPFMPVLRFPTDERELLDVARNQLKGRKPLGFELPPLTPAILPDLAALAKIAGVRLWINTLGEGYVLGTGGDAVAAADPDRAWGGLRAVGVSMIQTDNPSGLVSYERRRAQDGRHGQRAP